MAEVSNPRLRRLALSKSCTHALHLSLDRIVPTIKNPGIQVALECDVVPQRATARSLDPRTSPDPTHRIQPCLITGRVTGLRLWRIGSWGHRGCELRQAYASPRWIYAQGKGRKIRGNRGGRVRLPMSQIFAGAKPVIRIKNWREHDSTHLSTCFDLPHQEIDAYICNPQ